MIASSNTRDPKIAFLLKWLTIALLLVGLYLLAFVFLLDKRPFVEWTLIKGGPQEKIASAHLIKLPKGEVFLLNAGNAAGSLKLYLKQQKIKDLDRVILTTLTEKDISGLSSLLEAGVRIQEIWIALPALAAPTTPTWQQLQPALRTKGVQLKTFQKGETFYHSEGTQFITPWVDQEASLFRLSHGAHTVLVVAGTPQSIPAVQQLPCEEVNNDILLNGSTTQITWPKCFRTQHNLSSEEGTFKILLKGDSFKWKRAR